jgi:hypothetical protein
MALERHSDGAFVLLANDLSKKSKSSRIQAESGSFLNGFHRSNPKSGDRIGDAVIPYNHSYSIECHLIFPGDRVVKHG